ncbi:MAG: DUF4965 domain-containing protein [Clostridia bacterium]|nr:DUF4965 domain-containing protein [Clostridia bacterium]
MAKGFRAPAVPLMTNDPMTSLWSFADKLTDDAPRHWTGRRKFIFGTICIDGILYDFMGKFAPLSDYYVAAHPALPQLSCEIRPLSTVYTFGNDKITLELKFTSPLLPDDLMIMSRPVSYMSYKITSADGQAHKIRIYFGISGEFCVNDPNQEVFFGTTLHSIFVSSGTDNMLKFEGDDRSMEWGTLHVVAPTFAQDVLGLRYLQRRIAYDNNEDKRGRNSFISPAIYPENYGPDTYFAHFRHKLGDFYPTIYLEKTFDLENTDEDRIAFVYDDVKSLQYFGEDIEGYWKKDGDGINELLYKARYEYDDIMKKVADFEEKVLSEAKSLSDKYADIISLAFRQVIAGHKLTWYDGELQFVSKENFSNGCTATVDVTYPSIPMFLKYNPTLVEGMLNPIFKMIDKGLWPYKFAPHDAGTYPHVNGQSYGFYLRSRKNGKDPETKQMPVEECGNMIICVAGICYAKKDFSYFKKHIDVLRQWADYLTEVGYDPENQLCTDDFAGHMAHNINLSIKGICAIAAFGKMLKDCGFDEEGEKYALTAKDYAKTLEEKALAPEGDHYKLAFDKDDSWSVKYNAVWDRLLGLNLFSEDFYKKEIAFYKTKFNKYGLPLDNRADYTKTDWELWSTVLSDDKEYFDRIVDCMWEFLVTTLDRTPFTDWHFTTNPIQRGMQARTIQGGLFIKMLKL